MTDPVTASIINASASKGIQNLMEASSNSLNNSLDGAVNSINASFSGVLGGGIVPPGNTLRIDTIYINEGVTNNTGNNVEILNIVGSGLIQGFVMHDVELNLFIVRPILTIDGSTALFNAIAPLVGTDFNSVYVPIMASFTTDARLRFEVVTGPFKITAIYNVNP
jgi:hypothetical protein